MDPVTHIVLSAKLLEVCDSDKGAAIYSVLPIIDKKPEHYKRIYGYALKNHPPLLDSALEILGRKQQEVSRNSYVYTRVAEEKEKFLILLGEVKQLIDLPEVVSNDKMAAALSLVSHSYFNSIFYPTQFFLPYSSACCGQWAFWEKNNYFELLDKINEKKFVFGFREKLIKSSVWQTKFKPEDFSEIVKRRLIKEKAFDKKLDSGAMIKAMIIRMGEIAKPHINYEIIDYMIRSFFIHLRVKKYLRVDREIKFLRTLEKEIVDLLSSSNY